MGSPWKNPTPGRPDHDTSLFEGALGSIPLRGFFCNGEIGP
jgi:small ligand-binding sensory domain FIST